jgi:hypothetical protein
MSGRQPKLQVPSRRHETLNCAIRTRALAANLGAPIARDRNEQCGSALRTATLPSRANETLSCQSMVFRSPSILL